MKQRLITFWKSLPARRRKLIARGAGFLLFYTVFGFLILPWIVKAIAVKQLTKQLDRETTIRQVRINPYVLSGTIRGLLIKDKDGQPFISLEEAYANFQLSSFFGKPWVFKEVWTVKPYCRVQINKDYSLNFSDLLKKFSQPSPTPKKPGKPLFLHISRFQISGASASFTDLTPHNPFHRLIGPVEINLTELHTDPNNQNPYSFTGTTESGEKFAWSGKFSFEPLESSGELSLEGLSLSKYALLVQDLIRFDIKDGVVDGRATYHFALSGSNYLASVTNAFCSLSSLKVAERGGSENLVELDRFAVSGVSADVSDRTAQINQVAVDGARLTARRDRDKTINLVELAEPTPEATNAPGGVLFLMQAATNAFAALIQSTNLWSAAVHQIDVTNCSLQWEDQATARPARLSVDQFALSARHLSNVPGSNQTAQLSLRWNTNGTVAVAATVQIAPPSAELTVNVTNLELHPLDPYLEPYVNLFLIDSKVGVGGTLQMRMGTNALPDVTFRGDARLDDFATVDAQTEDLLKWKSVQVNGLEANLQPMSLAIKEVAIDSLSARVAFDTNQIVNLLAVLKTSPTNSSTDASAPEPGKKAKTSLNQKLGGILRQALEQTSNSTSALPKATVALISIANGSVQLNDRSVQPPVSASIIQELNGTISGVSSEELKRADIHLTAKAMRTGPIEITGKINPLSQTAPTELAVTSRDVDLSPTSPYTGKFLGYRLNRGRLGFQVDYQISQRHLKATNLVVLDQFTLGEKVESPDATKLPVKLALALLKDRNGKIEIDLPIDGNLDDPEFHFGKVILHVLTTMMTKLVTSPFAVLGGLFGGKGEEVSYQDFVPGSAQLQSANAQKLDGLIGGLYERPGLDLQIEGSFEPAADGQALRKQKLLREFRQQKWSVLSKVDQARTSVDQVPLSSDDYAGYLQAAYNAALRAGAATNAPEPVRPSDSSTTPQRTAPPPPASPGQKGATGLLQRTSQQPAVAVDEKERIVLSTLKISDDELFQLASERARNVQQRILDSGKIEASRLSLLDAAQATNRATRVFFHLQ